MVVVDGSFEAFFRAEHPAMVRSLTLALGDRSLAEDCAQVGFERAFARWSRVSQHDRPGSWVYVVAVRHGWRHKSRHLGAPLRDEISVDVATTVAGEIRFSELLDRLPRRQREAVVLRHLADLRLSEIAEAQRVTTGTVKASLYAAYERLRVEVSAAEEVQR